MKNILTTKELGELLLTTQKERQLEPEKWKGLPFGHVDLDKAVGGARRGELIVIAGAQKIGKTTVVKNVAMSFAKKLLADNITDEYILFISLEMGHEGLGARVFANEASIDITKFRDYDLDAGDYARLKVTIEAYEDLPALWDVGTYSYQDLLNVLGEYRKDNENKIRAIVIDYFQLFSSKGLNTSPARHEQLSALSRELKQLARQNDCTILVLSQQSREALTSFKKRKDPNTMAGTQALVRDCDLLIMILEKYDEDDEEIPHLRELYVGLSRNSAADLSYDTVFVGKYARTGAPFIDDGDIQDLEKTPDTKSEQIGWWHND